MRVRAVRCGAHHPAIRSKGRAARVARVDRRVDLDHLRSARGGDVMAVWCRRGRPGGARHAQGGQRGGDGRRRGEAARGGGAVEGGGAVARTPGSYRGCARPCSRRDSSCSRCVRRPLASRRWCSRPWGSQRRAPRTAVSAAQLPTPQASRRPKTCHPPPRGPSRWPSPPVARAMEVVTAAIVHQAAVRRGVCGRSHRAPTPQPSLASV